MGKRLHRWSEYLKSESWSEKNMIYPVKIYDKDGQLLKVVSSEEQLQRIWGEIQPVAETVISEGEDGKPKKGKMLTCEICKTVVHKFSFTAKFCSHNCAATAQNIRMKKSREKNRVPRKCKKCGKEFRSKGNRLYCQDPCESEFTAKRRLYLGV